MLQYSYTPTGRLVIVADTADILVGAMFDQFKKGLRYVADTYLPKTAYSASYQIQMDLADKVATYGNPVFNVYKVSDTTLKILARDSDSFLAVCRIEFENGYDYVQGSAIISTAANVVVVTKASSSKLKAESKAAEDTKLDTFDLTVALAIDNKDDLLVYCSNYKIVIPDSKKTLASIKNYLKNLSIQES